MNNIRDTVSVIWTFANIWTGKFIQQFTFKPYYVDYVKTKLKKRFSVKEVFSDYSGKELNCYLEISGGLTNKDKLNTAKMFGLTMRHLQFKKKKDSNWKIIFTSEGVSKIKSLINTFPNWMQQIHTGKTVLDFEPKEAVYLTHDQKLRLQKEGKKTWSIIIDILDYLFSIPILRDVLRQIFLHRDKLSKVISKIPKNEYDFRMYLIVFAGVIIFCLFMYTFTFWATLFCLLLAGYAIRRIKSSLKVKIIK